MDQAQQINLDFLCLHVLPVCVGSEAEKMIVTQFASAVLLFGLRVTYPEIISYLDKDTFFKKFSKFNTERFIE